MGRTADWVAAGAGGEGDFLTNTGIASPNILASARRGGCDDSEKY